jgi:uncharacterized membrane protein
MTKKEFLSRLSARLAGLPAHELAERLDFYAEMIDDRVEEGLSEAAAVAEIGSIDDIVAQILSETPFLTLAKERIRPKRKLPVWGIVLIALGSPVWVSLLIAAIAVAFSLYAVIWAVIASLWACFASFAGCGLGGILSGILFLFRGYPLTGLATLGASLVLASLAILSFYGCLWLTRMAARLTKRLLLWVKSRFVGKGEK